MSITEIQLLDLTDHEKKILKDRLLKDDPPMQRYTVFFPDDVELDPISLWGQVPSVGDRMFFRSYNMQQDVLPRYNHLQDFRSWYVKSVCWSYTVQCTQKDQLLRGHSVIAEVKVDFYRWQYWKWNFLLKFWYAPKRKIRKFFRSRKQKR